MSTADLIARIDGARGDHQRASDLLAEARDRYEPPEPPPPPPNEGIDISSIAHTALDFAGFIPGVGVVADLANAALYAAEGNYAMAGLSAAAAVPLVGDAAAAAKIAVKAVEGASVVAGGAIAATRTKKTFITYTFRDGTGAVRYVGRASGRGTPAQVMKRRISKGHRVFKANPHLTPKIEAFQGNRSSNLGAEDVFYEYHKREGANLLNDPKSPPLSSSPRKLGKTRQRIQDYSEDLKTDF